MAFVQNLSVDVNAPSMPFVFPSTGSVAPTTPNTNRSRRSSQSDDESCGHSTRRGSSVSEDSVVVVQFKWGRVGDFKSNLPLEVGTPVVVEAERGTVDLGLVLGFDTLAKPEKCERRIVRAATRKEQDKWQRQLVTQEQDARKKAQTILEEKGGLDIKIHHAEYQFDKKKLTFHYSSAEARPNFRPVLDELFAAFRCRVWFARYSSEAQERERTDRELFYRHKQVRKASVASTSASDGISSAPSTSPMEENMTVPAFTSTQ